MFQRHATDVISLVFGLIFAGLTTVWLLVVSDVLAGHQAWVIGPVVLVLAGAAGIFTALRPSTVSPAAVGTEDADE